MEGQRHRTGESKRGPKKANEKEKKRERERE